MENSETINQAFCAMINSNPQIFESQANQEAAWQSYKQVRGGFFPTVALAYNVGRGKGESLSPQTFTIGYTVENIQHKQIVISQLLFDGGALLNRVASAKTQYEAAYQLKLLQMNQLGLRAAAAYLAVLRSQEMKIIASENLQLHKRRLSQESDRYRGGAGTIAEYNLSKSRMEQAQFLWNKITLELENAKSAYREVIGHYPQNLIIPSTPSQEIPTTLLENKQLANQNNPAIISAKESARAARHDYVAAESVLIAPNISLQITALRDNNLYGIAQRTTSMAGYLVFTYNVFNGGADYAAMNKAYAQFMASIDRLAAKQREIDLAVEQTWQELQMSKKDLEVLKKNVDASRKVAAAFNQELNLGKRSLLDVLDTENEFNNARLALVDTKYKIKIDTYALLASAGQLANYLGDNDNAIGV